MNTATRDLAALSALPIVGGTTIFKYVPLGGKFRFSGPETVHRKRANAAGSQTPPAASFGLAFEPPSPRKDKIQYDYRRIVLTPATVRGYKSGMAIMNGYGPNDDFIAIDTATKAAVRGSKGSTYWLLARADRDAAAAEMIRETLALRDLIPDLPSVQPEVWNANFLEMAQLISR